MIEIKSREYWFKIVEFLQQNWALVDLQRDSSATIFFINDASGVFDRLYYSSMADAQKALRFNGFKPFSEDDETLSFIAEPKAPFHETSHPNGPIYSSGRFWKT